TRKMTFLPVEADDAAVGTMDASQNADQRGFARAVLPDDGVDFAIRHVEVDAVERHRRAEPFGDALSACGRTGHRINAAPMPPASSRRGADRDRWSRRF